MAIERIGIEVELGVERQHLVVAGVDQRIDLGQRAIAFIESLVQRLHEGARLWHRHFRHADLACGVVALCIGQALHRIDRYLKNFLGRVLGDVLDIHAALRRRHQRHALGGAIHHHADVKFFLDVGALFHQQALDQATFGAGLMGDEGHAENLLGIGANFIDRLGDLDTATLAAAAGVNLRLDHPHLAAQRFRRLYRLIDGETRHTARGGDAVLAQDFLALIFMDIHGLTLFWMILRMVGGALRRFGTHMFCFNF